MNFQRVHLFLDVSKKNDNSYALVNFLDKNIKFINSNRMLIELVPIISDNDKKELLKNNIDKLPALLNGETIIVGIRNIMDFIQVKRKITPKTKNAEEMLREAQMADMDINKYENGEYDDEESFDEDGELRGDPDAVKQNIQRRMAEFNQRRTGRTEDTAPGTGKRKKGKKKRKGGAAQRPPADDIDMYQDNVGPPPAKKKGAGVEVNPEEWDIETQQLLDKGGFDL